MKTCSECKKTKDDKEFNKHPATRDRLQGMCRSCQGVYQKNWKKKNQEHDREYQKARYWKKKSGS